MYMCVRLRIVITLNAGNSVCMPDCMVIEYKSKINNYGKIIVYTIVKTVFILTDYK